MVSVRAQVERGPLGRESPANKTRVHTREGARIHQQGGAREILREKFRQLIGEDLKNCSKFDKL